MWKALREDAIGRPRLVYAEMDDGMLHKMNFRNWITPTGVSWPVKDELETGCTVEHAGYSLTWLVGFFGPVESVTAFSTVLVPDKEVGFPIDQMAADFSVGVLRFVSGVVGRITTSIFATHNHAIRVFGDRGTLSIDDCWKPRTPVHLQRRVSFAGRSAELPWRSEVSLVGDPELRRRTPKRLKKVDFCLGPLDMVAALRERRSPRLSARYVLHVAELVLAIHNARENGVSVKLRSRFDPVDPMPWAR
jgi:predicted dehydrogenase